MKRFAAFIFVLIAIMVFALYRNGYDIVPDGVNRSSKLIYSSNVTPPDEVYLNLQHGYAYHDRKTCRIENRLMGLDSNTYIEISEYEAIQRGFFKCPACY